MVKKRQGLTLLNVKKTLKQQNNSKTTTTQTGGLKTK